MAFYDFYCITLFMKKESLCKQMNAVTLQAERAMSNHIVPREVTLAMTALFSLVGVMKTMLLEKRQKKILATVACHLLEIRDLMEIEIRTLEIDLKKGIRSKILVLLKLQKRPLLIVVKNVTVT